MIALERPRRGDEIRQYRSCLYGRELVVIAKQYDASVGPERREQGIHQQKRHHRRLVDDHDIVLERIALIVSERIILRPVSQEAVHGLPGGWEPVADAGVDSHRVPGLPNCFAKSCCGFPRRRGKCDSDVRFLLDQ